MGKPQKQDAVHELLALNEKLEHRNMHETPGTARFVLSKKEGERVKELCENNELAMHLSPHATGFSISVHGCRSLGSKAEALLDFNSPHLPRHLMKKTKDGQHWDDEGTVLSLFQITHTERNKNLVRRFNLKALHDDPSYYTY